MRYYDRENNRLVFCGQAATPDFWDDHWQDEHLDKKIHTLNGFVIEWTQRYLPVGQRVLEGGCGRGQNVHSLRQVGYEAYGVDSAGKTVSLVRQYAPELPVREADVRSLPFPDGFFHGYWSLGVIEHSYRGYATILAEMARVVCRGGYLFLTFPHMSLLRRTKALLKRYRSLPHGFRPEAEGFYQFALDTERVRHDVQSAGFAMITSWGFDAVKGLKDEVGWLKPLLQPLYDSSRFSARIVKKPIELLLRQACGHCALVVFRRE